MSDRYGVNFLNHFSLFFILFLRFTNRVTMARNRKKHGEGSYNLMIREYLKLQSYDKRISKATIL